MIADAITGPVEEFRSIDGALDYDLAKHGGLFVKIGVGVLRKAGDSPYEFMYPYRWWMGASGRCTPSPPGIFPATAPLTHQICL